jgi:branched-chain amino acid transport system substrate-binding protein
MAGLALISPSNTLPLLTGRSYLEVNRLIARADRQGFAAAQFAQAQGYKSVFIVGQKAENSVRNAEHFRVESGKLGIKRLGSAIESIDELSLNRIVDKIVKANPDLLYISSSARQAILLLTELRARGYMGAVLGTDRLDSPETISAAGDALVQGGGLYYTILNPPTSYYPGATTFIQDFTTKYGTKPRLYGARAYDATGICLQGIQEAAKTSGELPPTRAQVARAIRALKDYNGITGTYTFNYQGDPNPMQYYVYKVVSVDEANWDQNPIVAAYNVTPP